MTDLSQDFDGNLDSIPEHNHHQVIYIDHEDGQYLENNQKVPFEPSDFYVHEVMKFKHKHASLRDKVKSFNEA